MQITKNTIIRAARTFVQAAVAYIAVNLAGVDLTGEKSAVKTALCTLAVSSVAAGLSALMNLENKEPDAA